MNSYRTRNQLHPLLRYISDLGDDGLTSVHQAKVLRIGVARLGVLLEALTAVGLVVQRPDGSWITQWCASQDDFREAAARAVDLVDASETATACHG